MSKFITTTEDQISVNLPRWAKNAKAKLDQKLDDRYQLKLVEKQYNKLEAALTDMVRTYGDDVRCRAILKKHGLREVQ